MNEKQDPFDTQMGWRKTFITLKGKKKGGYYKGFTHNIERSLIGKEEGLEAEAKAARPKIDPDILDQPEVLWLFDAELEDLEAVGLSPQVVNDWSVSLFKGLLPSGFESAADFIALVQEKAKLNPSFNSESKE